MKLSKFIKTYEIGKSYAAPDGTYKGECVSLVKCYIKDVLGVSPQSIGDAKEYWAKRNGKYLKGVFKAVKGNAAKRGDVFVRTSGTYGHVGIVLSVDEKGFTALEQNAGGCRVVRRMYHLFASDIHFLRPINQDNLTNKASVKAGDKVTLKANNVCYKKASKKDYFTIGDLTAFKCDTKAQLKKGTKLTAKAVDTVKGSVWVKVSVGGIDVYLLAYSKKKDKAYIK